MRNTGWESQTHFFLATAAETAVATFTHVNSPKSQNDSVW